VDRIYSPNRFEGKGPAYVFLDADVEVVLADDKTLEDIRIDFQGKENQ